MREIDASQVTEAIATLCVEANCFLAEDVRCALCTAEQQESFAPAREILHILCRNEQIARQERMPICPYPGRWAWRWCLPRWGRTCISPGISRPR